MITVELVTAQDGLQDAERTPSQAPTTGDAVPSAYDPLQPRQSAPGDRRPRRKRPNLVSEPVRCPSCGSAFDTTTRFDDHRVGSIDNRRCLADSDQADTSHPEETE